MNRRFEKPNLTKRQKVEQMLNHPGTSETEKENCRRILKNMKPEVEVVDILYDDRKVDIATDWMDKKSRLMWDFVNVVVDYDCLDEQINKMKEAIRQGEPDYKKEEEN